jgi:TPR repeat protein
MIAVLTMGMSQRAMAAETDGHFNDSPVDVYQRAHDDLQGRAGADSDLRPAVEGFRRLAREGWAIAQHRLAQLYHTGTGVTQDRVTAYLWYQRAAMQHYPPSQSALDELAEEMTEAELRQVDRSLAAQRSNPTDI